MKLLSPRKIKQHEWFVAAIVVVVALGVIYAWEIPRRAAQVNTVLEDAKQQVIDNITIGTLLSATEADKPNPRLEQKGRYTTADPIAMRVTTTAEVSEPFTVNVRLVLPNGSIVGMDPPTVEFSPGTSSFCCWVIEKPGEYVLQVFRPEGIFSSIALPIGQATTLETGASGKLKGL